MLMRTRIAGVSYSGRDLSDADCACGDDGDNNNNQIYVAQFSRASEGMEESHLDGIKV